VQGQIWHLHFGGPGPGVSVGGRSPENLCRLCSFLHKIMLSLNFNPRGSVTFTKTFIWGQEGVGGQARLLTVRDVAPDPPLEPSTVLVHYYRSQPGRTES